MDIVEEIVDKIQSRSMKDILGYFIASEEDASRKYRNMKEISGELVGGLFEALAKDEERHKKILLVLYEKLFKTKEFNVPEDIPFLESTEEITTLSSFVEALDVAIANEEVAHRVYTLLAERDEKHRDIFKYLAMQEKAHLQAIMLHKDYVEEVLFKEHELSEKPLDTIFSSEGTGCT
ncbi:MAG: ferritin family protein [Palaeococcus sp.]|uniref:ferritin family protein n=1 Tax=Palaeococcus sp. (in: euryarchaeotes) TaxID=2820298 RepID=UPI0025D3DA1B|nr:ferritin family protein [Palaeococcus sp. (in: euryarchaeotes)]MCD6559807.1 ferritin family protein [Palaeococcus sp. (in: euryarchaeotes)]